MVFIKQFLWFVILSLVKDWGQAGNSLMYWTGFGDKWFH